METINNYYEDTIRQYLNNISNYPVLTPEEEQTLGKELKKINNCKLVKDNKINFNQLTNNLIQYKEDNELLDLVEPIIKKYNYKIKPNDYIELIKTNNIDLLEKKYNLKLKESTILDKKELLDNIKMYLNYLKAQERMINSNLKLVVSVAKKYQSEKVDLMDLISQGNMGLIRAVERFDIDKGYKFSTYAIWWIKQYISKFLYENLSDIKTPEEEIKKSLEFKKELEKDDVRRLSLKELAGTYELNYETIVRYMTYNPTISINTKVDSEDNDSSLEDFIEDEKQDPEEEVMKKVLKEEVEYALNILDERERKIISLKFGINTKDNIGLTNIEIAKMEHVTPERIRVIIRNGLRKIRIQAFIDPKVRALKHYVK